MKTRYVIAMWLVLANEACGERTTAAWERDRSTPDTAPLALAETYCETLFSCDCPAYGYGSVAECEQRETEALGKLLRSAQEAGLEHDDACMARFTDAIVDNGCAPEQEGSELLDECSDRWCAIYHGDRLPGEACTSYGFLELFSDCGQGLVCDDGVCRGCAAEGESCLEGLDCRGGLVCDEAAVCVRRPDAGAPCIRGQCATDAYCDYATVTGLCVMRKSQGQACEYSEECLSDECGPGTCDPPEPDICSWLLPGQFPF